MGEDSMNFKRTYEDPLGTPISLAFTSPPVRPSAFTKPTPSSLQSPRNGIESAAATPPAETQPKYRECLRNHAASHGGHVLDGCGEFMPADAPDLLKCAACGCHRSFHRRETELLRSGRDRFPMLLPPPPPPPRVPSPPPVPVAVGNYSGNGGGATTESSSEGHVAAAAAAARRKRFRTKFTPEQKGRMLEFAERAGWKMQKQDEKAVEQFCAEVGVRRQVLKVWMHNNKHNLRKEQQQAPPPQLQPPPPQLNNSSEIYSGE